MRWLLFIMFTIGAGVFIFGGSNSDKKDDAREVFTVIVLGTCDPNGCSTERNRCTVDNQSGVFAMGAAHGERAIHYLGNLGTALPNECPVGSVIIGVEGQEAKLHELFAH